MKAIRLKIIVAAFISVWLSGCATGGSVAGNGTASGGSVNVGPINADITPCVNMPGATSGNCKNQGNGQNPSAQK